MIIEYEPLISSIEEIISVNSKMVVATSKNNRVTARMMSIINFGLIIYFQTDKTFLKYEQIVSNSNIAMCFDNVQIEAKACIQGHPYDEKNRFFLERYQKVHNKSYKNYSHLKNNVVIRVEPQLITLWKYYDGKPYREILDTVNKTVIQEKYKID